MRYFSLLLLGACLQAAPTLRLTTTTLGPISVATGTAGGAVEVETYNSGDGQLNLSLAPSVNWLVPSTLPARNCTQRAGTCIPIRIMLSAAALPAGRHVGSILVTSPGANDGAQTVMVIVQVGGGVPAELQFHLPPNGSSDERAIHTLSPVNAVPTTQSGGNWLSVAAQGGSFRFAVPYKILVQHLPTMSEGAYNGAIQFSGSTFPPENRTTNVNLRVTSLPIARPSTAALQLRYGLNMPTQTFPIAIANAGLGNLTVNSVSATGNEWLTARKLDGNLIEAVVNPQALARGAFQGTITVTSNAANSTFTIPVDLEIVPRRAPIVHVGAVLNNATFEPFEQVAQGGIVAVFGEQFHYAPPVQAGALPLPTQLAQTRVLVNGRAAPIYYLSENQINFQIPFETQPGEITVQVERNGELSPPTQTRVVPRKPKMLRLLDSGNEVFYGIIVNSDGTFPVARRFNFPNSRPAREGDVLTIYLLGLGQSNPPATSGAASPSSPLPRIPGDWRVIFGNGVFVSGIPVEPLYVGLTPGLVGLYQVNVQIPGGVQKGDQVSLYLEGETGSDPIFIAIE